MSFTTSQDAVNKFGNRYAMIIAAAARARELKRGAAPLIKTNSSPILTALKEIEAGLIADRHDETQVKLSSFQKT